MRILHDDFPQWRSLYNGQEAAFVIMGAGQLGQRIAKRAIADSKPPCCFMDNNESLWGTYLLGIPVKSPAQAVQDVGGLPVIVAIANVAAGFLSVRDQLTGLGYALVLPVQAALWRYPDLLPNYYLGNPSEFRTRLRHVIGAYDAFDDNLSRETYVRFVRCRYLLDYDALPIPTQIYPDDLFPKDRSEIIADCGAYDGDTLSLLSKAFPCSNLLIGIEPDPISYAKLLEWKSSQQTPVQCFNIAVSDKDGQVEFVQTSRHDSSIQTCRTGAPAKSTGMIACRKLDSIFTRFTPTLIKMDIEGAEIAALRGSHTLISAAHTKWCVTTEHRQSDLWDIPVFFSRFKDKYTIHLRSHGIEGVDLICYAIPR